MKPGKLYTKIFLSFLLVLFVTEILIFVFFMATAGRAFRSRFEKYTGAKVLILKELVRDRISSEAGAGISEDASLKDFFNRLEGMVDARIWLTGPAGKPVFKSESGDISALLDRFSRERVKDFDDFKLYYCSKKHWDILAAIPIEAQGGLTYTLYIFFTKPWHDGDDHEVGFALGLIVIGGVVALLVIPISRRITGPINRLRQSALQIADGDLTHRAAVDSKDEIGELGRSFNHMADKLERMIRSGKELTANVSHELRSPLARIRVAEELLREKLERGDYDGGAGHMDDIREDIEELDRLIGLILDLSKLDIKEESMKFEPFDLSKLLEEILDRFGPVMESRHLRLTRELAADITISGDKEALRTALSNIIDNAVKFTPEQGQLIVKAGAEGDAWNVGLINTFDPLPEDDLESLFEPFFRTERTEATGSGLGLAITRKIIERHGGTIRARNADEGIEIRIRLPIMTL